MLIVIYVVHENSYDRHFKNADQIYQLGTTFIREGKENNTPGTPYILGETMQQDFPEVMLNTKLLSIFTEDKVLMRFNPDRGAPQTFYEPKGYIADSAFFHIFSYSFTEGNPAVALNNPRSIVISEEIANKFFGNQPALHKNITIASNLTGGDVVFTVTGVFKEANKPSHFDGHFFLSFKGGAMEEYVKSWGPNFVNNNMFLTYLILKPGADIAKLESKFPAFLQKYAGADSLFNRCFYFVDCLHQLHEFGHCTFFQAICRGGCEKSVGC
jgi:putative ABC transport system permease protein